MKRESRRDKQGHHAPAPAPARAPSSLGRRVSSLNSSHGAAAAEELLEQLMPMQDITRIMRNCLPAHAQVSGGAKQAIQECVLSFISSVTSVASEHCRQEQRHMVTGDDLLVALKRLSLTNYVEPLGAYLGKLREMDLPAMREELQEEEEPGTYSSAYGTHDTQGGGKSLL